MNRKDASGRNGRYFLASTMIVVGLACAALLTDSVGNTLATVLIGLGLILFVAFLFRDLGLSTSQTSTPRVPPEPRPPATALAADAPRSAAESARQLAGLGAGDETPGGEPADGGVPAAHGEPGSGRPADPRA